jgi:hypothetical protein
MRPWPTRNDTPETCPECGASVPIVADRWLDLHRAGSAEYPYPRGNRPMRCPGSLLQVRTQTARHARTT